MELEARASASSNFPMIKARYGLDLAQSKFGKPTMPAADLFNVTADFYEHLFLRRFVLARFD